MNAVQEKPKEQPKAPASLVRAKSIGKILDLTDRSIYNYYARGIIPGYTIGSSIRFNVDEVLAAIKHNEKP